MATVADLLAAGLLLAGAVVIAFAAIGVARFPDPFTRMHAATKAGVVGCGLILLGAGMALGTLGAVLTSIVAVAFLIATTPVASHLLGRAAYLAGAPIAPATVMDALEGVVDRGLFDIPPAQRTHHARRPPPVTEEAAMTAVPSRNAASAPSRAAAPMIPRRLVCWLGGGATQKEASAVALALAGDTGARLLALSMLDPEIGEPQGAVPIGGSYWAKWLAGARRTRMRQAAAGAFAEFQELANGATADIKAHHAEGAFSSLPARVAACDLIIVPAGVDPTGERATHADEIATLIARARLIPVLRVNHRVAAVRHVAILVGTSPPCSRLAHGLSRCGLWPGAAIAIIPVGEPAEAALDLAQGQVELLRAHGREAELCEALDGSCPTTVVATRLRRYDVVVMSTLSTGSGWFGPVRTDIHEHAAETCAMVLLP